ncbi:hypothetical protein MMC20_008047 [Loxospora ochrophaea]|nr:hypothetical protein [Loxospora ochrophaea]
MTNPFVKFVPDSTEPRADEGFLPVWSWPQEKTVEFLKRLIDNEDIFDLYVGNQNDLTKAAKQILRAL